MTKTYLFAALGVFFVLVGVVRRANRPRGRNRRPRR